MADDFVSRIRRQNPERSRSRSRSRSGSLEPRVITTELSMFENSLMDDDIVEWLEARASALQRPAKIPVLDKTLMKDDPLKFEYRTLMLRWQAATVEPDPAKKLCELIEIINLCGSIRERIEDTELWLSLFLLFQDYTSLSLVLDKTVAKTPRLEFCGLCQTRAIGGANNLVIRKSHLMPSFIQNLVFFRRLPRRTSVDGKCTPPPLTNKDSPLDIACVPLLCQTTEANGQGCEDMFSRWEQQARELLYDPVIRNLSNTEPVAIQLTHHIYKFAVSLFFRSSLELPRKGNALISLQGFRAARWLMRRHGAYADVFPVFFAISNVVKLKPDEEPLKGITDRALIAIFAKELIFSARVEAVDSCVVISAGPVHFVVDCSLTGSGCDYSGSYTLELLTFGIVLEPNGARPIPKAVQKAVLARAMRQPREPWDSKEVTYAECILSSSKQDLVRIMAETKLLVDSWYNEDELIT